MSDQYTVQIVVQRRVKPLRGRYAFDPNTAMLSPPVAFFDDHEAAAKFGIQLKNLAIDINNVPRPLEDNEDADSLHPPTD